MTGAVPVELEKRVTRCLQDGLTRMKEQGHKGVVLCSPRVRPTVRQMLSATLPEAAVLAYSEVDCSEVESVTTVGVKR